MSEAELEEAVAALAAAGLLDTSDAALTGGVGGGSQRAGGRGFDRRVFLGGAAAGGAALVAAVAIPTAAAASSGTGGSGGSGGPQPSTFETAMVATGPCLYYRLDETSGSTAADSSGNNRKGTYGSVSYRASEATSDGDTAIGVPSLDATNEPVSYTGSVPQKAWSIAAFFKIDYPASGSGSTAMPLMGLGSTDSGPGSLSFLDIQKNGAVGVDTVDGGTALSTDAGLLDGNWHYLVLTWDGSTYTLYVDGSSVGSGPSSRPRRW